MDEWATFVGSKTALAQRLKKFASVEDYAKLNDQIPAHDRRYKVLLSSNEIRNLIDIDDPEVLSPIDGLVLICLLAWNRAAGKFRSPEDLASLFLVFGRYLFVAYQYHIVCNPNSNEEIKNHKMARSWIQSKNFDSALEELNIVISANDLENGRLHLSTHAPTDSLSRPLQRGIELLYGELCLLFGIKPIIDKSQPRKMEQKSTNATSAKITLFLQGETIPVLPPFGSRISLSEWLVVVLNHLHEQGKYQLAGDLLWNVQGFLPGCCSRSWEKLNFVFNQTTLDIILEPRILALALITRNILQNIQNNVGLSTRLAELDIQNGSLKTSADYHISLANEYIASVEHYMGWKAWNVGLARLLDVAYPLHITVFDNTRGDNWLGRHVLSEFRESAPGMIVQRSQFWVDRESTLSEILMQYLNLCTKQENILAFAESLTAWGIERVDRNLERIEKRTRAEKHYRTLILRRALSGLDGYSDWV